MNAGNISFQGTNNFFDCAVGRSELPTPSLPRLTLDSNFAGHWIEPSMLSYSPPATVYQLSFDFCNSNVDTTALTVSSLSSVQNLHSSDPFRMSQYNPRFDSSSITPYFSSIQVNILLPSINVSANSTGSLFGRTDNLNQVLARDFQGVSPSRPLLTDLDRQFLRHPTAFLSQSNRTHFCSASIFMTQSMAIPSVELFSSAVGNDLIAVAPRLSPSQMNDQSDNKNELSLCLRSSDQSRPNVFQAKVAVVNIALNALSQFKNAVIQVGLGNIEVPPEEKIEISRFMQKSQEKFRTSVLENMQKSYRPTIYKSFGFNLPGTVSNSELKQLLLAVSGDMNAVMSYVYSSDSAESRSAKIPPLGTREQQSITLRCGINNTTDSVAQAQSKYHEQFSGKLTVDARHVHDSSFLHGITLVALQKLGLERSVIDEIYTRFAPKSLVLLEKAFTNSNYFPASVDFEFSRIESKAKEIIATGRQDIKQLHIPFSNGGAELNEILSKLPQAYQDTVIVINVGTTQITDPGLAHKVFTLIGDKDWPSLTSNGGMGNVLERARNENIQIVSQDETLPVVSGHYYVQPDYLNSVKNVITDQVLPFYELR